MRLLRTSSTLKRLFPGPGLLYKPCAPVTRRVNGLSQGHTATTTRPPWAHQTRFASSDPNGSGQDDDPYKVLGVSANVAQSKIQPAFHALALKLHPDRMPPGASDEEKKKRKREFQDVQAAYEKISTAEARAIHDDAVRQREREKAAQRAQDAAATAQAVQPAEQPKKSDTSSAGDARFVNRETWKWMMKKQKEADAQRERILAAQKKREEDAQKDKKRRDQEAALRDRNKPKAPAQTKDSDGGTASHEQNQPKSEPKSETKSESRSESRSESAPGQRAGHTKGTEEKGGAASARKPTVNRDPESLRVAILRFRPGTTVPDVVDRLASSSVGAVADIHIMESGVAKIDFFRADSARKLQHLIRGGNFTVNGEKVKGMALQVSGLPMPQDPLASRVLMLTDPRQVMPVLGSEYVKFILRQDYHICPWVAINTLSVTRTEVHFRSWREAEKVTQILESHFPGIHVRYAIDPATGDKEPPRSLLVSVFTARDLPNSKFVRVLRRLFTLVGLYISCNALLVFYGQ